jgi:phosphoesterase RecJ-like protein
MGLAEAATALERHRHILVTSHYNPDGDNIGSQLGLAHLLKRLGKKVEVIDQDAVPDRYRFLPGWEGIKVFKECSQTAGHLDSARCPGGATLAVVLDSAGLDRIGRAAGAIVPARMEILNIDHHVSNDGFGQVQYLDPAASSTCELVCRIAKKLAKSLTSDEASCLLCGIITDTGGFRYASTSPATMRAAAELMEQGAELSDIATRLYFEERPETLRLLGELLVGMKRSERAPLAWMSVGLEQLARHGIEMSETEEFVRYALSARGVEVGLMFKEQADGQVRLSFRSKGRYDVNRLARLFGGGGHTQAAGARVPGRLSAVQGPVIEALEREMASSTVPGLE